MASLWISKIWQILSAAICYTLFGLGAVVVGLVFRIVFFIPFISAATKQTWIRWCIHMGCLAFINMMRLFGLIRYRFDLETMMTAKPGHIIIANHPSLIDVVLLFAAKKNLNCIVKGELWDNVFTSAVVRLAGFIPNNSLDAVTLAIAKLSAGENLIIFPEGTRSEDVDHIKFKRGASNIAVAAQASIMPVLIKCHPSALKKGDKWYNIPDGGADFTLSSGELLYTSERIDTSKPKTRQYRELTQFLENYYKDWMAKEPIKQLR